MPIKLNSTGGGSVTLTTPSTASDFTVTVPAVTGTLVTSNGASTIEFAAGTVSAPSITTNGDTNTGIYFPAADTIAFTEGGVESMRIDSSGNVGVGTSSPSAKLDVNGNTNITGTVVMSSSFLRNRIINGDMRIDQRNAGASGTANQYTVDRFAYYGAAASKGTWQQNAGSVTPPAGFTNYLGFTSSSAYTVGATEQFNLYQPVEGFNVSDLAWGTANAKTVTLSFWVRSSLTGTFGGSIYNSAVNRSYPYSYTISSANTWEYKTITVSGDTSGTWLTTNGVGLYLNFSLGAGSTVSGTAGAWAATRYDSATGATSVVGTNGATFYITGVQLEVGTAATPFERRQYGQELALCQRYYEIFGITMTSGATYYIPYPYKVTKRAAPTLALVAGSLSSGTIGGTAYNPEGAMRQINSSSTAADAQISATAEL